MIDILKPLIKQFMPFAQERMGFDHPPRLFLRQDTTNADNPLGKTAYYDPQAKSVTIYVTGRHPKDVMRSLSHELVHHKQNCDGEFDNIGDMGEGSAQTNPGVRQMEVEANRDGNMCFRDWEDSIKGTIYNEHLHKGVNNTMSIKEWKNRELTTLLSEAWGFGFDLKPLNEDDEGNKPPWLKKKGEEEEEEEDLDEAAKGSRLGRRGGPVPEEEEEDLDEAAKGSRTGRRGRPMTPEEEEEEGYDPSAETWKRGVKGAEVTGNLEEQIRKIVRRTLRKMYENKK